MLNVCLRAVLDPRPDHALGFPAFTNSCQALPTPRYPEAQARLQQSPRAALNTETPLSFPPTCIRRQTTPQDRRVQSLGCSRYNYGCYLHCHCGKGRRSAPSGEAPSRGWLYRFQKRTGLWFSLRHGEGGSLNNVVVVEGAKELRSIVSKYNPRDVYSMDDTLFFYRREPKGTLTVDRTEKGKTQSKERITVCVATNADETDHFLFISLANPRCCGR